MLYQDYTITAMGYLNNVTPFIPYLELPFVSILEGMINCVEKCIWEGKST